MANYTSRMNRTLMGRPGTLIEDNMPLFLTLTANEGYRFADPHGLSVIDEANVFETITITRDSGRQVTITLDVRDNLTFPVTDDTLRVRIVGDAVVDRDGDGDNDVIITFGDGDGVDTDGDMMPDADIDFDVDDGDMGDMSGDDIILDVDADEGDEIDVGNALICPRPGRRFREGRDGRVIFPRPPADRVLGNGYILRYHSPRINDQGCVVFRIRVIVGNGDFTDGDLDVGDDLDGLDWDLIDYDPDLDDEGDRVDEDGNPDTDGDYVEDNSGGGDEDIPDDDDDSVDPTGENGRIFNITINTDNVDPIQGGFIIITATGDPGATGTVRLTPSVVGTGVLPASIGVITVNLEVEANGVDIEIVRIPSVAGDENLNPLCTPDTPDGVDGVDWDVDATDGDGNPIDSDTDEIRQDQGGQVCFRVTSTDDSLAQIDGSTVTPGVGWTHTTLIQNTRGFEYPSGIIRLVIPPNSTTGGATTGTITPSSNFTVGPVRSSVTWPGPTPPWPNGSTVSFTDGTGVGTGFAATIEWNSDSATQGTVVAGGSVAQSGALNYSYGGTETSNTWTLIDPVDGVVTIDNATDVTCSPAGFEPFCNGTVTIDGNGNLVLSQPYDDGIIPETKSICTIDLDNLATQDTEVQINWEVPAGANYSVASRSQSVFTYSGRPGASVPSDGGDIPTEIVLVANTGYVWNYTDLSIMASQIVADDGNTGGVHVDASSLTFNPTLSSLQADGRIGEITISWALTGNFPQVPRLQDIYTITPAGNTRRLVTNTFDFGADRRGHDTLVDATFGAIDAITGVEGGPWSVPYTITADSDHVFKAGNTVTGVHFRSTHGATVSPGVLGSGSFPTTSTGTISGTYGNTDDTIQVDGNGQGFRNVTLNFTKTNNTDATVSGVPESVTGVEGDAIDQITITLTTAADQGFTSTPTIVATGGATVSAVTLSGGLNVDGTTYSTTATATLDYTLGADDTQGITITCDGGGITVIPAQFIRVVTETAGLEGVTDIIDRNLFITDSDGDGTIGDETVAIQFDVHTDAGFAWDEDALSSPEQFTITTPTGVTGLTTVLMGAGSDVNDNEDAFIRVSGTYNVPDDTAGNTVLRVDFTIGGTGPTGLSSITASPTSLTFDHDDDTLAEGQTVTVNLSNPTNSADTISHTTPTGFTVVAPATVTQGADRVYTIHPSAENTDANNRNIATVTFSSTDRSATSTTVNLTQNGAPVTLSGLVSTVTLGMTAGSSMVLTPTTNGNLSIDTTNLATGYTAVLDAMTGEITITATNANNAVGFAAGGTFTVTASNDLDSTVVIETVTVRQTGMTETLTVNPTAINIPQAGNTATPEQVTITYNNGYTIAASNDAGFTITPLDNVDLGMSGTTTVMISRGANTNIGTTATAAELTATIIVTSRTDTSSTHTVNITQPGIARTITIDGESGPVSDNVDNGGEAVTLDIVSNDPNITWTAVETTDSDGIISNLRASGGVNDNITYMVASNGPGEPAKTATITVTFRDGDGNQLFTRVITVTLAAGDTPPDIHNVAYPQDGYYILGGANTFESYEGFPHRAGSEFNRIATWTGDTDTQLAGTLPVRGIVGSTVFFSGANYTYQVGPDLDFTYQLIQNSNVISTTTPTLGGGQASGWTDITTTTTGMVADGDFVMTITQHSPSYVYPFNVGDTGSGVTFAPVGSLGVSQIWDLDNTRFTGDYGVRINSAANYFGAQDSLMTQATTLTLEDENGNDITTLPIGSQRFMPERITVRANGHWEIQSTSWSTILVAEGHIPDNTAYTTLTGGGNTRYVFFGDKELSLAEASGSASIAIRPVGEGHALRGNNAGTGFTASVT